MVSQESITRRLRKLEEYISLLDRLSKRPKKAILSDPFVYGNVERYLQLAIQTVIDISNYILAERKVRGVDEYREAWERLGTEKIIPAKLASRIAPMAGLRNILVLEYLEVDRAKLYDILQHHLKDLKEFAKHISKIL